MLSRNDVLTCSCLHIMLLLACACHLEKVKLLVTLLMLPAALPFCPGESYGGVYVPLLTRALLRHNQRLQQQASSSTDNNSGSNSDSSSSDLEYNLAGYIVGNAVTDDFYDGSGQAEFAFGMGLIDPETYKMVKRTCKVGFCE